jgi:hypothetical protein
MPAIITIYSSKKKGEKSKFIKMLAPKLGISESSIRNKIKGLQPLLKLEREKIAELLNIPETELFPNNQNSEP